MMSVFELLRKIVKFEIQKLKKFSPCKNVFMITLFYY